MLDLLVCFISSDLTANKLFPINPRGITGPPKMSLLLEVESLSAYIIEPWLILGILVMTYKLPIYIDSIFKQKLLFKNSLSVRNNATC